MTKDLVLSRTYSFLERKLVWSIGFRHQHLLDMLDVLLFAIANDLLCYIIRIVNLFSKGKSLIDLGEYITINPLISLVTLGASSVGTVWHRLVLKITT